MKWLNFYLSAYSTTVRFNLSLLIAFFIYFNVIISEFLSYFLQESMSAQSVNRVRRFQREVEAAEERAENAESNLNLVRAKHRTFVTTSNVPGSQVYLVSTETTRSSVERY